MSLYVAAAAEVGDNKLVSPAAAPALTPRKMQQH